jgi:hypothetical protein
MADPIGRFHRTFSVMFTMVFGGLEQSLDIARRLHRRHGVISGTLRLHIRYPAARSIILRSSAPELSNNIIQKGLAFIGDWSGTVV